MLCYRNGKEYIYLGSLFYYKGAWYCDVVPSGDDVIDSNIITLPLREIKFPESEGGEELRKALVQAAIKAAEKKIKKELGLQKDK